jgi:Family of unknown function (DUF6221)
VDDLTAFVAARLGEREAAARELLADNASARAASGGAVLWDQLDADARTELREAESMRAILKLCAEVIGDDAGHEYYSDGWAGLTVARRTAAHLAAIWSDHPGYRQEWKPEPLTAGS